MTSSTILSGSGDVTLVAHWAETWVTDIPDGVYSIASATNADYSLDMPGGSSEIGESIILYRTNNTWAQRFRLARDSDGTYKITFVGSGLTIEAHGTNQNGWPCVRQAADKGLDSQRWYIHQTEDGWYSFRNKGNGLFIDITNNELANGVTIECHSSNGSSAQKFNLKKERYAIVVQGLMWPNAKAWCERIGGHLACITSASEQTAIDSLITIGRQVYPKSFYWIGGYKENGAWKWVTGEKFNYSHWGAGEPNNAGAEGPEDKILMSSSGYWIDKEGTHESPSGDQWNISENGGFICEWEDAPAASTTQSLTIDPAA